LIELEEVEEELPSTSVASAPLKVKEWLNDGEFVAEDAEDDDEVDTFTNRLLWVFM